MQTQIVGPKTPAVGTAKAPFISILIRRQRRSRNQNSKQLELHPRSDNYLDNFRDLAWLDTLRRHVAAIGCGPRSWRIAGAFLWRRVLRPVRMGRPDCRMNFGMQLICGVLAGEEGGSELIKFRIEPGLPIRTIMFDSGLLTA